MEIKLKKTYLLMMATILVGCRQSLPANEYIKWVEDEKNGLCINKTVKGNDLIIQFQPLEYIVLLGMKEKVDKSSFDSEIKGLQGYYYFSFKIKPAVPVNANQDYFNYQLGDRFLLITENDSLKCAFFHQESTHNFSPYLTFLLAFKKEKSINQSLELLYNDESFGMGPVKIGIDKLHLKKIVSLKIE